MSFMHLQLQLRVTPCNSSFSFSINRFCDAIQGIVTAPILFAVEEFAELHEVVDRLFDDPANVGVLR